MNPDPGQRPSLRFTPTRIIAQFVGFAVGVGLLIWCLRLAWASEDGTTPWEHFSQADPRLIVGLFACTVISLLINGSVFWLAFRPVQDVGWWNMQRLNLVSNGLNYVPLRPGTIARIAYHLRVDRLGMLDIGACFVAISVILLAAAASIGVASLMRGELDWLWLVIAIGGLVASGGFLVLCARVPLARRYGRGFERVLGDHSTLWALLVLRVVDLGAYAGRLTCAMAIVGLPVDSPSYIALLAIVAMLVGLFPIRIGFREAGLAFAAGWFGQMTVADSTFNQLALIESAGEALVYIPFGVASLWWYRIKWAAARRMPTADPATGDNGASSA